VSTTLTRQSGNSALPPDDTPDNFHRPADPRQAPPDLDRRDPYEPGPAEPPDYWPSDDGGHLADAPAGPPAHHADMTLAEVRRAVPATSRRARDQLQALAAGLACPDLAGETPKSRDKLEQWWRIHVLHASWGGEGKAPRGVSSPGRDRVCELIRDRKTGRPISRSTYKRLRRWWEARGYIAIVRPGWTPDLSPGILHGPAREHNMTQAYVLCVPRRAEIRAMRRGRHSAQVKNGPLSVFSKTGGSHTRAREENPETRSAASCCYPTAAEQAGEPGKTRRTKGSLGGGVFLLLGAKVRVTDGWWAHLTRPFARWEPESLQYAIDHYPDGTAHVGTAEQVRNPAGWLRWRLSHWLHPDGTARLSPAGEAAERARRHRARQAAERAELGIAERAARIRAAYGTTADGEAPERPRTASAAPERAERPLTGWAARGSAPAPRRAPVLPVPRWRQPDPEWDAAVAAAAAAVAAEETATSSPERSVTHPDLAGQVLEDSRNPGAQSQFRDGGRAKASPPGPSRNQ
jgi:hypothetical protein